MSGGVAGGRGQEARGKGHGAAGLGRQTLVATTYHLGYSEAGYNHDRDEAERLQMPKEFVYASAACGR